MAPRSGPDSAATTGIRATGGGRRVCRRERWRRRRTGRALLPTLLPTPHPTAAVTPTGVLRRAHESRRRQRFGLHGISHRIGGATRRIRALIGVRWCQSSGRDCPEPEATFPACSGACRSISSRSWSRVWCPRRREPNTGAGGEADERSCWCWCAIVVKAGGGQHRRVGCASPRCVTGRVRWPAFVHRISRIRLGSGRTFPTTPGPPVASGHAAPQHCGCRPEGFCLQWTRPRLTDGEVKLS